MKEDPTFEAAWADIVAKDRAASKKRVKGSLVEAARRDGYRICGYVKVRDLRSGKYYYIWPEGK